MVDIFKTLQACFSVHCGHDGVMVLQIGTLGCAASKFSASISLEQCTVRSSAKFGARVGSGSPTVLGIPIGLRTRYRSRSLLAVMSVAMQHSFKDVSAIFPLSQIDVIITSEVSSPHLVTWLHLPLTESQGYEDERCI